MGACVCEHVCVIPLAKLAYELKVENSSGRERKRGKKVDVAWTYTDTQHSWFVIAPWSLRLMSVHQPDLSLPLFNTSH